MIEPNVTDSIATALQPQLSPPLHCSIQHGVTNHGVATRPNTPQSLSTQTPYPAPTCAAHAALGNGEPKTPHNTPQLNIQSSKTGTQAAEFQSECVIYHSPHHVCIQPRNPLVEAPMYTTTISTLIPFVPAPKRPPNTYTHTHTHAHARNVPQLGTFASTVLSPAALRMINASGA